MEQELEGSMMSLDSSNAFSEVKRSDIVDELLTAGCPLSHPALRRELLCPSHLRHR